MKCGYSTRATGRDKKEKEMTEFYLFCKALRTEHPAHSDEIADVYESTLDKIQDGASEKDEIETSTGYLKSLVNGYR